MISLKEWNSFDSKTRRDILETLGENTEVLSQEYHHNFDFDRIGKVLKQILSCCYKQPNNTIKVCATVVPTYIQKSDATKPVVKKQETPKMKRYICCYEEEIYDDNSNVCDHDSFKEWCEATNLSEARNYFEDEHPDNRIIDIWEE
jgi:hypothetical protein